MQVEQSSRLKAACLVNLALLCQKEESFGEALKWCEKALQEQPTNAKAVYRQAQVQPIPLTRRMLMPGGNRIRPDCCMAVDADADEADAWCWCGAQYNWLLKGFTEG